MKLLLGDALEILKTLESESVDACVTDPPYGLSFMGKKWDYDVPSIDLWCEVLRVLKPGGHLLSFGGTRTYHRMVVAIEDAGFGIRDQLQWIYGSGFPKSLDVSKSIDREAGVERKIVGSVMHPDKRGGNYHGASERRPLIKCDITLPSTDAAKKWQGWGTALKPANEPICLARKPLCGTVAENVQEHGTGALNIDGCRIEGEPVTINRFDNGAKPFGDAKGEPFTSIENNQGRWPSNVLLDESAAAILDEQSGISASSIGKPRKGESGEGWGLSVTGSEYSDSGGASRFFYVAKASNSERNKGTSELEKKFTATMGDGIGEREYNRDEPSAYNGNHHPTVKPIDLMRYLVRMITPFGARVLDPFMGSGTTGVAANIEGCEFIGIEIDREYFKIAQCRIKAERTQTKMF